MPRRTPTPKNQKPKPSAPATMLSLRELEKKAHSQGYPFFREALKEALRKGHLQPDQTGPTKSNPYLFDPAKIKQWLHIASSLTHIPTTRNPQKPNSATPQPQTPKTPPPKTPPQRYQLQWTSKPLSKPASPVQKPTQPSVSTKPTKPMAHPPIPAPEWFNHLHTQTPFSLIHYRVQHLAHTRETHLSLPRTATLLSCSIENIRTLCTQQKLSVDSKGEERQITVESILRLFNISKP